ncbi:MAG: twin-arginine translocation signal domain-containing protein, partial [Acidobacteriota bacterium]|nr:twin-arginine translocation signal domain-containing protein [Acidobacteriota bacterium]
MGTPRQVAEAISSSRRDFLRTITGAAAATAIFGIAPCA